MATKITAPASCGPTREIALFTAEATPELRTGTLVISAVVSGATIIASPNPKTICAGRKSTKYSLGGIQLDGSPGTNTQAGLVGGTRANQRTPIAMSSGPTLMKIFGPNHPASAPNRVERKTRRRPPGMPASPAAAAEYPSTP